MSTDDYQILAALDDQSAEITFSGNFEGRDVLWCCDFVTLKKEYKRLCSSSQAGIHPPVRCFIEINAADTDALIRVGLNVPLINESAIKKMILMVRNYKHLRQGRHEFGDIYPAE